MHVVPFNNNATNLFGLTLREIAKDFDRIFYNGSNEATETTFWAPRVNISESPEEVIISADLPGVRQEDLSVQMDGDSLILRGSRREDIATEGETFHRVEKTYGAFQRTFTLPMSVERDHIKASLKDGVLKIAIPKHEEAKPKLIPIEVESE